MTTNEYNRNANDLLDAFNAIKADDPSQASLDALTEGFKTLKEQRAKFFAMFPANTDASIVEAEDVVSAKWNDVQAKAFDWQQEGED